MRRRIRWRRWINSLGAVEKSASQHQPYRSTIGEYVQSHQVDGFCSFTWARDAGGIGIASFVAKQHLPFKW